ncbi:hypothetical protein [Rhodopirellula sp. SWK7]|nr:hypothetical protein [Rhodopirellula sp. SWK7]
MNACLGILTFDNAADPLLNSLPPDDNNRPRSIRTNEFSIGVIL